MTRKPAKQITKRDMLAYANFVAPAFGREAPDVPKARAKSRDLEHKEQVAVIQWWAMAHKKYGLPEFALFAIPNGGHRHMLTAVRLKAEGVRPGIPDLMLAKVMADKNDPIREKSPGLFIEMKSKEATASAVSDAQKELREYLNREGYQCVVAFGADEAIAFIKSYLGE